MLLSKFESRRCWPPTSHLASRLLPYLVRTKGQANTMTNTTSSSGEYPTNASSASSGALGVTLRTASRASSESPSVSRSWGDLSFQTARESHVESARAAHQVGLSDPRDLVLAVNSHVGHLCLCFRRPSGDCAGGLRAFTRPEKDRVALELGAAFALLLVLANQCNVDLPLAVELKIELNAKKYPALLVRGSALKYDAYQEHTGFGKGSKQVTTEGKGGDDHLSGQEGRAWSSRTLEDLRVQLEQFAKDRGWEKFHTPRNICLALSGEAGELCEVFQFKDEEACCKGLGEWTRDERDKLSQELSDVCIYLCRLSDVCGVNLPAVLEDDQLVHSSCRYTSGYSPAQDSTHERNQTDDLKMSRENCTITWGYLAVYLLMGLAVMGPSLHHISRLRNSRLP